MVKCDHFRASRAFIKTRDIPYYFLIALLCYLVIIYLPILYRSAAFKIYVKNTISSFDRYTPSVMRAMILAEAEKNRLVIDDIYIEPKEDKIVTDVKWHVEVKHAVSAFNHLLDFKTSAEMKTVID